MHAESSFPEKCYVPFCYSSNNNHAISKVGRDPCLTAHQIPLMNSVNFVIPLRFIS